MALWITLAVLGIIGFITLLSTVFFVKEKERDIVQRFGKFLKIAEPGLRFRIPFIDWVVASINMRIQQLDVSVETKTKDNVFVNMKVSVQYKVKPDKVYEANYMLEDTDEQINSYIFDVVRAEVPKMELDNVFENKEKIAAVIKSELDKTMDDYGYDIVKALVTDIDPATNVKEAMNRINAAEREKVAANAEGEASKIKVVKAAEAEAESKRLQGEGIAKQRIAIISGLKESVEDFKEGIPDSSSKDVMELVLITQYFDTVKDVGTSGGNNTIFLPHSPAGFSDVREQILSAFAANK